MLGKNNKNEIKSFDRLKKVKSLISFYFERHVYLLTNFILMEVFCSTKHHFSQKN